MNRHINKISNYAMVGGLGAMVIAGLQGCGDAGADHVQQQAQQNSFNEASKKEAAFVVIQEVAKDKYQIVDEYPSSTTRVVLKKMDGTEKILTQEELDALVKEEAAKVDAGTSELTKNPEEVRESGGMGLAGTLMASMAAGMVGSFLMNKLMNNQNYQQNRRSSYKSPQTYSKSKNSFKKAKAASSSKKSSSPKKSGFFSNNKKSSSRSSSFGG